MKNSGNIFLEETETGELFERDDITIKFRMKAKKSQISSDLVYLQRKMWDKAYYLPVVVSEAKEVE